MYKIKEGFMLREMGYTNVVVATGKAAEGFKGMIKLNSVGAFMWKNLSEGITKEKLLKKITDKYDVSPEKAEKDIEMFLSKLKEAEFLE